VLAQGTFNLYFCHSGNFWLYSQAQQRQNSASAAGQCYWHFLPRMCHTADINVQKYLTRKQPLQTVPVQKNTNRCINTGQLPR